MEIPFYNTIWFNVFITTYFLLGLISCIYCVRKAGEKNLSTFEWGIVGYILPILSILILSIRQSRTES